MEKAAKRVKSGVVAREWLRADRKGRLLFSKLKKWETEPLEKAGEFIRSMPRIGKR